MIEEYKIKGDMLLNKKTEKGKIKKEYKEVKETYNRSFPAKHYNLVRFLSFWLQDEKARAYAVQKLNLKKLLLILNSSLKKSVATLEPITATYFSPAVNILPFETPIAIS